MEGEEMENRLEPIPANSYLPLREIVYETLFSRDGRVLCE